MSKWYTVESQTRGDRSRLFRTSEYFTLAIGYSPAVCIDLVQQRKWILKNRCDKPVWRIHGLFESIQSDHEKMVMERRRECRDRVWRSEDEIVLDKNQIPDGYKEVSGAISAQFQNDLYFWDHEWCVHGYFTLDKNKQRRFQRPRDYFDLALRLFRNLTIQKRFEDYLVPDNTDQFMEKWNDFTSLYKGPLVTSTKLHGETAILFLELKFCFDLQGNEFSCAEAGLQNEDISAARRFYLPASYSLFAHVVLRIILTSADEYKMKILDLLPSSALNYLHNNLKAERKHHIDAFQDQMYRETDGYGDILNAFKKVWFQQHNTEPFDCMKSIFEDAGILLYEIGDKIKKPLDYFATAINIYETYNMSHWLHDFKYGSKWDKNGMKAKLKKVYKMPEYFTLMCTKIGGKDFFQDIRICFKLDLETTFECVGEVVFNKRPKLNERRVYVCPPYFFIPNKQNLWRY
ncbi:hypothetical protein B4U80_11955 [Leptotrombidium deliense]|uniref:Uncharacterized protein n=1 Tax=Leptotrombidium deliense TaxID=299467 RepID=A0A443S0G4_9ACAR|nr:hypothetical protein B4U80_11955 [Leptotrombidium deliense]